MQKHLTVIRKSWHQMTEADVEFIKEIEKTVYPPTIPHLFAGVKSAQEIFEKINDDTLCVVLWDYGYMLHTLTEVYDFAVTRPMSYADMMNILLRLRLGIYNVSARARTMYPFLKAVSKRGFLKFIDSGETETRFGEEFHKGRVVLFRRHRV